MLQCPAGFNVHSALLCSILDGSSEHGARIWINQLFRFVKGIWLHRKSRQIRLFLLRLRTFAVRSFFKK